MQQIVAATMALLGVACAATPDDAPDANTKAAAKVILENDAIEDFIVVAELEEVSALRYLGRLDSEVLSERYVLVGDNRRQWVLVFATPCRKLEQSRIEADLRRERNAIYAKFDTYRGCRIDRVYEISDGQAEELKILGDAPGEG